MITYLTVVAGGTSDEAIGRLAAGTLLSKERVSVRPVAFMMALPAILATYSSIALLAGLVVMVIATQGPGIQSKRTAYILVTMIPVSLGFIFLCISVIMSEIGSWVEIRGRREYLDKNKDYCLPAPPTSRTVVSRPHTSAFPCLIDKKSSLVGPLRKNILSSSSRKS